MARYGRGFISIGRDRNVNLRKLKKGLQDEISQTIYADIQEMANEITNIINKFFSDVRKKGRDERSSLHSSRSLSRRARLHDHHVEVDIVPVEKTRVSNGVSFVYTDYECRITVKPPASKPRYNVWHLMDKGQSNPRFARPYGPPMVFFAPIYRDLGSSGIFENSARISDGLAVTRRETGASIFHRSYVVGKRGKRVKDWSGLTLRTRVGRVPAYHLYARALHDLTSLRDVKANGTSYIYSPKTGDDRRRARYFRGKALTYRLETRSDNG